MINITNLSKQYGKKILFEDLNLTINRNEKIGLIGPNGAGKSTFFSLLLGELEPSSGDIHRLKNIRIGYLPQEAAFNSERTVISELIEGDDTIVRLKKEKSELEGKNEAGSMRYGEILHELDTLGYFELEHKAEIVLAGLGFKERDYTRPIKHMSGGWQMRVLLGKLLTCYYDLLLLDEPTNYLDLNAAIWLKGYLSGFQGTFIMISHDKAFLNEVTNYSLILENGMIAKVHGNYDHYERTKSERRLHLLRQFKEQEKKRQQLQRFVERFHGQPNKAQQVRAKRTALEKMQEIDVPPDRQESIRNFHFPATKRSGYRVIALENVNKSYGDIKVYEGLNFEILQGEKAVLAGENGAGKSTLLKMLAGVVPVDSGTRVLGHNVDVGYFSQTRMDVLNESNTVLKEAYTAAPGYMAESVVRTILAAFLFTGDDADKRVSVLSGGEKSRLILAKLLINPPNLLLLDEPTTHLDVDAVEALVKALKEYEGTVVFISHDIHFVRSLANMVYEVKSGRIRKFPDSFDYYLSKRDKDDGFVQEGRKKPVLDTDQKRKKEEQVKRKEEEKKRRHQEQQRKRYNSELRKQINKLEKDKEKLRLESSAKVRALSDPRIYGDQERAAEYGRRLKEIENIIEDIDSRVRNLEEEIIGS